jgi:predicted transcriptional regulator
MSMKNIAISFNLDDEDQLALYNFIKYQSNGKKRNTSAYLKMLADREFQKSKTQDVTKVKPTSNGGIKFDLRQ